MQPIQKYVFDVGQGDHVLLELPDRSFGIIEAHYYPGNTPVGVPPGLHFLEQQRKRGLQIKLSFLHITHYHSSNYTIRGVLP